MAFFSSPSSWPPDPTLFEALAARLSKSSTLVHFAVGACMVFFQHMVHHIISFGGMESGRALLIGKLVPALEGLLTAFGGLTLGIGSPPPIMLLDAGRPGDVIVLEPFVSSGFDLNGDISKATGNEFMGSWRIAIDPQMVTTTYTLSAPGFLVLAIFTAVWTVLGCLDHLALTPGKKKRPTEKRVLNNGLQTPRRPDQAGPRHDDDWKDGVPNDSDDDSDDDDPPPPGPGSGLHHEDDNKDGSESFIRKYIVNFLLGFLFGTALRGLKKLKTEVDPQIRNTSVVGDQIAGVDYGPEWDVLEGTYGFSRSRLIASRSKRTTYRHNSWARIFNIRAKVRRAKLDLTRTILVCLENLLQMFGMADFVVLLVMPSIAAVLESRDDEQDNTAVEVDERLQPGRDSLTHNNELSEDGQRPARRREDGYPGPTASNISNEDNPWSSPRPSIDACATRFPELIVRHNLWQLDDFDGTCKTDGRVGSGITDEVRSSMDAEPLHLTSTTLLNEEQDKILAVAPFGNANNGERPRTPDTADIRREEDLDSSTRDECEEGLPDDLSDVESFTTAESNGVGMEEGSLENVGSNVDSEEEIGDPSRLFPGSFSMAVDFESPSAMFGRSLDH